MKHDIEYRSYSDSDRLAMLENRAAELERRLRQVSPGHGDPGCPAPDRGLVEFAPASAPQDTAHREAGHREAGHQEAGHQEAGHQEAGAGGREAAPGYRYADSGYPPMAPDAGFGDGGFGDGPLGGYPATGLPGHPGARGHPGAGGYAGAGGYPDAVTGAYPAAGAGGYAGAAASGYPDAGVGGPGGADERTEVLINRGRRNAPRSGPARWLAHWKAIAAGAAAALAAAILIAVLLPGGGGAWPASVATVQREIAVACQNPNVVSEPSQVNFACAKDTRQILWVFSLLTSGNNPNFTDPANGRKGLEPITPAQGGDIAWSLNLHHPYDPASPTDSLEVAARAINNIIGGATLTGTNGAPVVQPGLESNPANCARYTGSSALVTRAGFPALCALPVSSAAGEAALVSDVFQQWMVGAPKQLAAEAGVLFENADNPGDPRVQAILNSLPDSGL
jgi:hypothetical protein